MAKQGYFLVEDLYKVALENAVLPDIPNFPVEFVQTLPPRCPECGDNTIITTTLSMLQCGSDNCSGKQVQRLVSMIKDLGVLDMGVSKCKSFLNYYGVQNPYAIFAFEPLDENGHPAPDGADVLADNISHAVSVKIYNQIDRKRNMTLSDYVKIGNLQGIRDSALHIFGDYDDLETFYNDFEFGLVGFIQEKLGIKNTSVSAKAIQITEVLQRHKEELFEFIDYVNIKKKQNKVVNGEGQYIETQSLNICLSTSVGSPYRSKRDFVDQMEELAGDDVILNVLGGVSNNCHILVWSKSGAETSKVRKAYAINEKAGYEKVRIMTGTEFKNYLESKAYMG